ncbi:hypothetical protein C1I95_32985 [Micromonospora craterilacus]|uniref:Uncharacterized protein n=1 Tax=Micromonospora craterilacus TaxID=1655439 RepID=A0A2W2DLI2_9ACTN|nr:hypothetical protein [Micromonospora craterilacus]PZG04949.1 hypothetical protein C1I95_32985 [Micromonospora craterilacus]
MTAEQLRAAAAASLLIPIRVPATASVHTEGGIRTLDPDHPLYDRPCPVCGGRLGVQLVVLVYVGVCPDDRKSAGYHTGAAVAVHAACAVGPEATENCDVCHGDPAAGGHLQDDEEWADRGHSSQPDSTRGTGSI